MKRSLIFLAVMAVSTGLLIADDGLLGENRGGSGGGGGVGSGGGNSGGSNSGSGSGSTRVGSGNQGGGRSEGRPESGGFGNSRNDAPTRVQSRSGTPNYRQNNNQNRGGSSNSRGFDQPTRIESFGGSRDRGGEIARQARTEEQVRRTWNDNRGGWRQGYYAFDHRWNDSRWSYPYYQFSWNPRDCVVSPFYGWHHVPPYFSVNRVRFGNIYIEFGDCSGLRWNPGYRYSRWDRNYDEYVALDQLNRVFTRRDLRALDSLVPTRDWVRVRGDWADDYSLPSDDFYDMLRDVVTTTTPRVFNVQEARVGPGDLYYRDSRRGGDWLETEGDYLRVTVDYLFQDSWRRDQRTQMEFILEKQRRGNYQIVEFATFDRWR